MKEPKVYLAGGMHTDWQADVIMELNSDEYPIVFYNPMDHQLGDAYHLYGPWDVAHVDACDILFLYHEKTNPGFACTMEAAYAKGKHKFVIGVIEKGNTKLPDRYIKFVENFCDVVFDSLEDGIEYLKRMKTYSL